MNKLKLKQILCRYFSTAKSRPESSATTPYALLPLMTPNYGCKPVQRGEFNSGIRVAAANQFSGTLVSCTIMFQVGSVHECDDSSGVTHFIRTASSTSGHDYTGFKRARYVQQAGGYITCRTGRQTTAFTLCCPEPAFRDLAPYLSDAAGRCQYPEHELDEVRKIVRADLQRRPKDAHALDLVQKACFRGPYSNSIYCEESHINRITSRDINKFVGDYFKTNVCSVASYGVKDEETMRVASQLDCNQQVAAPVYCLAPSCPRGGFEFYDTGKGETCIALGVPGCGTCDVSCFLKHAILAAACGIGNIKASSPWDFTMQCPLGNMSEKYDILTSFKAFNISYLHGGCFGILVKTQSNMARCAGFKASEFLGNIDRISPDEIQTGKKRLKLGIMLNDESCQKLTEGLATQLANGVACDNAIALGKMIDSIFIEDVQCVAKIISQKRCYGQMAMAVVGDVEAAPHDAELRCA